MAEEISGKHFWGLRIWDSDGDYYTEVAVNHDLNHVVPTDVIEGMNAKYPFVIYNGEPFYYKGSASGNFSDNKSGECESDYNFDERVDENGVHHYNVSYIDKFVKWLHNKKLKYIKFSDALIIPVRISGDIQWQTEKSIDDGQDCKITFEWVQNADSYSEL